MDLLSSGPRRDPDGARRPVAYLLHKLQAVLEGGVLRATGFWRSFIRRSIH